ncbi:hypothetical protein [Falsirhodobacter halotolerans]|uniref:hypothetical protein n=1 Tax=Falsirhodobacter halotolerans TaxID=1146892 RepID=UPI001FCFE2BB|nr:hypothetical protein [Falsirhodobacter halotolerans]MCJ8141232.1 hypothetical protein [Falsirhodobacter halotolerans]
MTPETSQRSLAFGGYLAVMTMLATIVYQYSHSGAALLVASVLSFCVVVVLAVADRTSPRIFVLVGAGLVLWAVLTRADWGAGFLTALERSSFVIALFTALTAIRTVAIRSPAILSCGQFLADQRPGLRYIALTLGGQLFGLILLYGSIGLLGSLAAEASRNDPDAELRRVRLRRMMVAISRGFASTLCWSPLGFSIAVTMSLVPGANWNAAVLFCLVSSVVMVGVGWAMDTIFKPKLTRPAPRRTFPSGGWVTRLLPLYRLLGIIVGGVAGLHVITGVDVVGAVMSFVPLVAIVWIWWQADPAHPRAGQVRARIAAFVTRELPSYGGQILLLFMASFIGNIGAFLMVPIIPQLGLDLGAIPPWAILLGMLWIIPLTGQVGMNPILAVSLLVPILPAPEAMGISPIALVVAITGGWALSGVTSPFTASVMIVASLAGVRSREVGLRWNGAYVLVVGSVISVWALLLAWWL